MTDLHSLFPEKTPESAEEGRMSREKRARKSHRRRIRRIIGLSVVGLLVLVLVGVGWVSVRAVLVAVELQKAVPLAAQLQTQVLLG